MAPAPSARRHVVVGALCRSSAPARPLLIWASAACTGNAAQRQPLGRISFRRTGQIQALNRVPSHEPRSCRSTAPSMIPAGHRASSRSHPSCAATPASTAPVFVSASAESVHCHTRRGQHARRVTHPIGARTRCRGHISAALSLSGHVAAARSSRSTNAPRHPCHRPASRGGGGRRPARPRRTPPRRCFRPTRGAGVSSATASRSASASTRARHLSAGPSTPGPRSPRR